MPDIEFVRREIEYMRVQVGCQRNDILKLQRTGISTASARLLLQRMLAKIEGLCAERDKPKEKLPGPTAGKCSEAGSGEEAFLGLRRSAAISQGPGRGSKYRCERGVVLSPCPNIHASHRSIRRGGDRQLRILLE